MSNTCSSNCPTKFHYVLKVNLSHFLTGATGEINKEILEQISRKAALTKFQGELIFTTGSTTVNDIPVNSQYTLISAIAKIAPSPDWFVGVHDFSLCNETTGKWLDKRVKQLFPYDAGTDSAPRFVDTNTPTIPPVAIFRINSTQEGSFKSSDSIKRLGTFTFEKTFDSNVQLSSATNKNTKPTLTTVSTSFVLVRKPPESTIKLNTEPSPATIGVGSTSQIMSYGDITTTTTTPYDIRSSPVRTSNDDAYQTVNAMTSSIILSQKLSSSTPELNMQPSRSTVDMGSSSNAYIKITTSEPVNVMSSSVILSHKLLLNITKLNMLPSPTSAGIRSSSNGNINFTAPIPYQSSSSNNDAKRTVNVMTSSITWSYKQSLKTTKLKMHPAPTSTAISHGNMTTTKDIAYQINSSYVKLSIDDAKPTVIVINPSDSRPLKAKELNIQSSTNIITLISSSYTNFSASGNMTSMPYKRRSSFVKTTNNDTKSTMIDMTFSTIYSESLLNTTKRGILLLPPTTETKSSPYTQMSNKIIKTTTEVAYKRSSSFLYISDSDAKPTVNALTSSIILSTKQPLHTTKLNTPYTTTKSRISTSSKISNKNIKTTTAVEYEKSSSFVKTLSGDSKTTANVMTTSTIPIDMLSPNSRVLHMPPSSTGTNTESSLYTKMSKRNIKDTAATIYKRRSSIFDERSDKDVKQTVAVMPSSIIQSNNPSLNGIRNEACSVSYLSVLVLNVLVLLNLFIMYVV